MGDVQKKVLVIDDDREIATSITDRLRKDGYDASVVSSAAEALASVEKCVPDIVLIGSTLHDMSCLDLSARIRRLPSGVRLPIILLTAVQTVEDRIEALKVGIHDYVAKPVDYRELLVRIDLLLQAVDRYSKNALRDDATGLYNFAYFEEQFEQVFGLAKRYGRDFSIIVVDIDNLQAINEETGFRAGTGVLVNAGERLVKLLRKVDVVSRLGNDEFAVILPETTERQANVVLDRVRRDMRSFVTDHQGKKIFAEASIGCAAYQPSYVNKEEMFNIADKALSEDKKR